MTILVMGTIKLGEGEGAKAAKLFADHAAVVKTEEGCEEYSFAFDAADPDLVRVAERWANADRDRAGFFQEGLTRPQFAGIVSDRHDLATDVGRQIGTAGFVTPFFAGSNACAFRENNDVKALLESLATLGYDLVQGIFAGATVDRDHFHRGQSPADEGEFQ